MRVLYISYNGALEPLAQSQVLPYLRGLVCQGVEINLLTFEKLGEAPAEERAALETMARRMEADGLRWIWRRYHKRPSILATLFDIFQGQRAIRSLARERGVDLIHARGTTAAMMGYPVALWLGVPFLFDVRGLMAEEFVDGGLWPRRSFRYAVVSRLERAMLRRARGLVFLAQAVQHDLASSGLWESKAHQVVETIPCCVDLERFHFVPSEAPLNGRPPVFCYLGSIGTWQAIEEMLDCVAVLRQRWPGAPFRIVTQADRAKVAARVAASGAVPDPVITSARPEDVPHVIGECDVGLIFMKRFLSGRASSPIKLAEFLACGRPVLINAGIGDTEALVLEHKVGVVVHDFSSLAYRRAGEDLARLLEDGEALAMRCRRAAEKVYALEMGVDRYRALYQSLIEQKSDA